MFGTLKNILNKEWYQNKDNYVIKTSSLSGSYVWQVFSVYKIPNTNDYIKTNFNTDSEYQTFLNLITKRSIYDFKTNVTINNKILTFIKCFKILIIPLNLSSFFNYFILNDRFYIN